MSFHESVALAGRAGRQSKTDGLVVQRKCACGTHARGGECEACRKKRMGLQRSDRSRPHPGARLATTALPTFATAIRVQRQPIAAAPPAPEPSIPAPVATPASTPAPAPEATTETAPEVGPEAAPEPATAAPSTGLIAEDGATALEPGQVRKSEFLAQLESAVCAEANAVLAATGRSTEGCPYLAGWFAYYRGQSGGHVEAALHRYAPDSRNARTAAEYIPLVAARVRQGVERWATTGEISGVPEGVPLVSADSAPAGGAPATGNLLFKAQAGGARATDDPAALRTALGSGRALESGVRGRMERAFGQSFAHVRTHTDATARQLSAGQNARAFTVGEHVAFGAGEYRPGTLLGDALVAHELAHVVQQKAATTSDAAQPKAAQGASYGALEEDADRAAINVIGSLWSGAGNSAPSLAGNAAPRLTAGLRLSRCKSDDGKNKKVCLQPVSIAKDDGSDATTQPSFQETKDIWKKCCIDVSVKGTKTVNKTAYQELDESKNDTPTQEEADLFKDAGVSGSCVWVFVPLNFQQDGNVGKDISGGGGTYHAATASPEIVVVEGIKASIVAHELGHAMGYRQHGPADTVMQPSGAHNVDVKDKVTEPICEKVRKFTSASSEEKACTITTP